MTVVIVCDVLGEENNGTTIAAMNLIRYLKAQGHETRILCADQDKNDQPGVYVAPNLNLGFLLNAYVAKAGVTLAKPEAAIINRALEGADHVHVMMPFSLGIKAAKLALRRGLPVTAGFHMQAQNFTAYIGMNKVWLANWIVYQFIYRQLFRRIDAIHYPTQFIREVFEKNTGCRTKGYVISNGVHAYVKPQALEKPPRYRDKIVILTTGRYSREKSQDTLLKAVRYSKYKDKIQLILGGQGVKEARYRKLAQKLPVKPVMQLYSRTQIIDVLNYADLYVHPAEVELEGIACIEAIACGKLTIVSDSSHAATKNFAVDSKCVFKNRNPKDLARVIDYWIEHPHERQLYESRYLESSAAFAQDACMQQMEDMIREVGNEKKNR